MNYIRKGYGASMWGDPMLVRSLCGSGEGENRFDDHCKRNDS